MDTVDADVYVDGTHAATLTRNSDGGVTFSYRDSFLSSARFPIATTLPLTNVPLTTTGGAVPPFFAGLLPEGRRLSALKRSIKTSVDDELSLLLAVGEDTVGNVSVVPAGEKPIATPSAIFLGGENMDFTPVFAEVGVPDAVGIAGVQEKASARTIAVPTTVEGADAILKLSPPEYPQLVENENACLVLARESAGRLAEVVDAQVVTDANGISGLLVHRFDRSPNGVRYAVEDVTQLLGLYPAQKYNISYEELSHALAAVSGSPMVALRNAAYQLALAWLMGNGDLHAKNISVIRKNGRFDVAPIYDIPSTVPYGDTTLALSVQGRRDGLSVKKYFAYTDEVGLPRGSAERIVAAALAATKDADERIVSAANFDARRARDIRRVLRARRKMWGQ